MNVDLGAGISINYSKKDSKLECFFQTPTLNQLLKFKIIKFNEDSWSSSPDKLKGKQITEGTYKLFMDHLVSEYSEKSKFQDTRETMHDRIIFSYFSDPDDVKSFLDDIRNSKKILHSMIKKVDPNYKDMLENFDEDSWWDWDFLEDDEDLFQFILICNGWSTSIVEKNNNAYVRWSFCFDGETNELVDDVFKKIDTDFIDLSDYYRNDLNSIAYSPFNLDEFYLYSPYALTYIFENNLEPDQVLRIAPLQKIPDNIKQY